MDMQWTLQKTDRLATEQEARNLADMLMGLDGFLFARVLFSNKWGTPAGLPWACYTYWNDGNCKHLSGDDFRMVLSPRYWIDRGGILPAGA